jgi:hypothetical protein
MKRIIAVLGIALLVTPALAAAEQQDKAKACNSAAVKKGLKGDKAKAYVKSCLTAKARKKPEAAAKPTTKPARSASPAIPAPTTSPAQTSAAAPAASSPNSASDKKWMRCDEIARQSNVSPMRKKDFMDKCVAG